MTTQPTPEQIADAIERLIIGRHEAEDSIWLEELSCVLRGESSAFLRFRIVRPEDHLSHVPMLPAGIYSLDSYNQGRGDLWRDIFGEGL